MFEQQDHFIVGRVPELYASFKALDKPVYYSRGGKNPYAGCISIIPEKANFYVMVPATDPDRVMLAKRVIKGLAGRRKVREHLADRHEVNYPGFIKGSRILVLWA